MSDSTILKVAVNVPLSRDFDYLPPASGPVPAVGCRVLVPFGRRQQIGMVTAHANESVISAAKIRRCSKVLDENAILSDPDLWLIRFASDYYHHPIGEVVSTALPALLRQGKPLYPTVERVAITDSGAQENTDTLAKRAPRQAELLEVLIDAGGDGLDADLLTETLPTWRRAAKPLGEKGLLSIFKVRAEDFDERLVSEQTPDLTLNADQ